MRITAFTLLSVFVSLASCEKQSRSSLRGGSPFLARNPHRHKWAEQALSGSGESFIGQSDPERDPDHHLRIVSLASPEAEKALDILRNVPSSLLDRYESGDHNDEHQEDEHDPRGSHRSDDSSCGSSDCSSGSSGSGYEDNELEETTEEVIICTHGPATSTSSVIWEQRPPLSTVSVPPQETVSHPSGDYNEFTSTINEAPVLTTYSGIVYETMKSTPQGTVGASEDITNSLTGGADGVSTLMSDQEFSETTLSTGIVQPPVWLESTPEPFEW